MARIQVSCPHCNQLMQVNATDANRRLRCTRCHETFRKDSDGDTKSVPVTKVAGTSDPESVIGVRCHVCDSKFGIKSSMSGRTVACPTCKAKQKFLVTDEETRVSKTKRKKATVNEARKKSEIEGGADKVDSSPAASKAKPAETKAAAGDSPVVQLVDGAQSEPETESDSVDSEKSTLSAVDSGDSRKALALLPPTYTVPEEVEAQVAAEFTSDAPGGIVLGIDTELTRIQSGDQAVEVRSVSREEKMRRRRIRVGIVYLLSVGILIAWFIYLLNRSTPDG